MPEAQQPAAVDAGVQPVLRLSGITKRFGALTANDVISLQLQPGEILALLGENGAGKTTLMSILFGHYVADEGGIEAFGAPLPAGSPKAAISAGIGMVHQHFTLGENLSVLDNIVLGTEALWSLGQNSGAAKRKIETLAERFGLDIEAQRLVRDLSVGERQRVEILKALYRGARILILDEPTAVLTPQEVESFFATLKAMVADGLSIIFISHKLNEVMAIADRVAVLRQGSLVADFPIAEASRESLAEAMVGRAVALPERNALAPGATVLAMRNLSLRNGDGQTLLKNVTLTLRAREVLGIAGVSGNGQGALADLLSGLVTPDEGDLEVLGEAVTRVSPAAMLARGIGRVPEDRHATGVIGDFAVEENLVLEVYGDSRFSRLGFLKGTAIRRNAETLIEDFDIRGADPQTTTRSLSGGNMQKVILARVLTEKPKVILANQPTRGLDVGAAATMQRLLFEACAGGAGVILISEDLEELLQMSDRVAVLYQGQLSQAMPVEDADLRTLGLMMAGHSPAEAIDAP
ncbi:ABC transporter ATP-binding protein [Pelagibius litoralis]|uniref:ABC transporter ATP-binding protein n=1 Tax=Pelagibius litoralis TaxID=374515 RepID=A0A967EX49_9PROT|nr:ABC transporter ATP-binding protein [Pelagibius litoralis]NIA67700.1 ABC transporter ATP-binding protein [Pelagibius litoralis]